MAWTEAQILDLLGQACGISGHLSEIAEALRARPPEQEYRFAGWTPESMCDDYPEPAEESDPPPDLRMTFDRQWAEPAREESSVYAEIRAERARQDSRWGGPDHDDKHGPNDWIRMIRERNAYDERDTEKFRRRMVVIAALAVAGIETHDRMEGKPAAEPAREEE